MDINGLFDEAGNIKVNDKELRNEVYKALTDIDYIDDKEIEPKRIIDLINKIRETDYDESNKNKNKFLLDLVSDKMNKDDVYRFVYELVQNADDCTYGDEQPTIKFDVDKDKDIVIVSYNEKGFRVKDIVAITDFGGSTKNRIKNISDQNEMKKIEASEDLQLIGEKGIGFKTIFRMVKKVEIHSNGYHFELTSEKPTLPKWIEGCNYKKGTTLKLFFKEKDSKDTENYAEQFFKALEERFHAKKEKLFTENPILFTRKLQGITVSNGSEGPFTIIIKKIKDSNRIEIYNQIPEKDAKPEVIAFKYSKEVTMSEEAYKSRYPENEVPDELRRKYTISVLASMVEDIQEGKLYSFLPTGIKFDAPIVIDAPFKLKTDRGGVEITEAKEWNEELLKAIFLGKDCLLEEFYKQFAEEIKSDEGLNILKYIIPFSDTDCKIVTMSDNTKAELYYGLLTEADKETFYRKIKELSIIKIHNEDNLAKIVETVVLKDKMGYEFPKPKKIIEEYNKSKNENKSLGDVRYTEEYNKEIKGFWENLKKIDWQETIESVVNSMVVDDGILRFLNKNHDKIKEKFENLNIYPALMKDNVERKYLNCSGDTIWIEPIEGKSTFSNYAILNNEILSEEKYNKLFEFHKGKIKATDEWINEIVNKIKERELKIEELKDKLEVLHYFTFNGEEQNKDWDCRDNNRPSKSFAKYCFEDNLFTENGICEKITETPDLNIGFNNCIEFYKKIGCRQNNDFFIFDNDYIKLDDKTNALIQKCENRDAIDAIKDAYKEIPEEDRKPLKIEFHDKMLEIVKIYIIKNEIIEGDALKNFCKEALESSSAKAELMLWALSKLEKKDDYECKALKIEIEFEKAKELTIKTQKKESDNENEDNLEFLVNKVMKEHKLENFKIMDPNKELEPYTNDEFNAAIELFYKQQNNIFTNKEYYKADLGEGTYIFDTEKVILNIKNTEECLNEYVKKTSRKDDFKNYIEFIKKEKGFKSENPKSMEEAKRYINKLSDFRVLNYKTSLTDIGRLIEQINNSNDKPQNYVLYEILQNINDARRENVGKCHDVADVRFTFEDNIMKVEYFEKGFTAQDVYNITSLSAISKTDDQTGEKGIGFKTIFSIFDKVEIHSGYFHFSLSNGKDEDPKFIVPTWIDTEIDAEEYIKRTEMIFTLKENRNFESIKKQLKDIRTFLFLKNISTIQIDSDELIDIEKHRNEDYYKYTKKLSNIESFNIEIMKSRDKWKQKTEEDLKKIKGKLAVEIYIPKKLDDENKGGCIYTALPTEEKINCFVYLNVPFELTTGRNKVQDNSDYNEALGKIIFSDDGIYKEAMEKFAKEDALKNNLIKCLIKMEEEFVSEDLIKSIKFIENYENDDLISIKEAYIIPDLLYKLIEKDEKSWKNISNSNYRMPDKKIVKLDSLQIEEFKETNLFECQNYGDTDLVELFKKIYKDEIAFSEKNPLHQFLKETLWEEIKNKYNRELRDFYQLCIFPYKTEEGPVLSSYESQRWYEIKDSNYKGYCSTKSYKILDESYEAVSKFSFGYDIHEFNEQLIIGYTKEEMNKMEKFSENWWSKAREIFDLKKKMNEGEVDGHK